MSELTSTMVSGIARGALGTHSFLTTRGERVYAMRGFHREVLFAHQLIRDELIDGGRLQMGPSGENYLALIITDKSHDYGIGGSDSEGREATTAKVRRLAAGHEPPIRVVNQ